MPSPFECALCNAKFISESSQPTSLPCGHNLCFSHFPVESIKVIDVVEPTNEAVKPTEEVDTKQVEVETLESLKSYCPVCQVVLPVDYKVIINTVLRDASIFHFHTIDETVIETNNRASKRLSKTVLGGAIVEIQYQDSSNYKGQILNDLKHGRGKLVYANQSYYDGQFIEDKKEGKGVFQFHHGGK